MQNNVSIGTGSLAVTYTPATDYTGTDTFTYTVTDSNGHTDTGTVTVRVFSGQWATSVLADEESSAWQYIPYSWFAEQALGAPPAA